MSNYTKSTNFTAKDSLTTGNPSKKVLGAEIDTELTAIETAVGSKADTASPIFTGTVTLPTVAGNRTDSGNITQSGTITMSSKSFWDAEGANVASAADCNIWTTDGNTVHVTGTTQIDDWGTAPQAGAWKRVIFDGSLLLNYNATTNDIPGDEDKQTVAGDSCIVYARSTSSYQIFDYTDAARDVAGVTRRTAVATTSGSSQGFTSIPAGVKKISAVFSGVSTNAGNLITIQLGISTGYVTTGYLNNYGYIDAGNVASTASATNGFNIFRSAAAHVSSGIVTIENIDGNVWVASGTLALTNGTPITFTSGNVDLGGVLDRIQITTADTFDAGSFNVIY